MASKTGSVASGGNLVNWRTINITLGTNEIPISITFNNPSMALVNGNNEQIVFRLYLVVDNSWANYTTITDKTIAYRASAQISGTYTIPVGDRNKFKGKTLYIRGWVTTDEGSSTTRTSKVTMENSPGITVNTYVGVVAGDPIRASDYTQTGKSATNPINATNTSGGAMSGIAYASTFNSQVLGIS